MRTQDPASPGARVVPSGPRRFHRTAHLAAALTRARTPDEVLRAALDHATAALHAYAGGVFLLDPTGEALVLAVQDGYPPDFVENFVRLPLRAPALPLPVLDTARDGEARFLTSGELRAAYPGMVALPLRPPGSVAALPMSIEGRLLGVIALSFPEDRRFSEIDRDFALTLAGLGALALERTRAEEARLAWQQDLERQVEERTRELRARHDALAAETAALHAFASFTEAVGVETRLDVLTRIATDVLRTAFGEGCAGYYGLEGGRWRLLVRSGHSGEDDPDEGREGLPEDFALFRDALQAGDAAFVEGWPTPGHESLRDVAEFRAVCASPVRVGERTLGFLGAGLVRSDRWSERDRAVFRAVGRSLTLAAERADGAERARRQGDLLAARNRELEETTRRLREVNAELDAFSYSVSHDLRAPLRHVLGFAGLLRRHVDLAASPKAARYLDVIEESTLRMNTLVEALLEFARTSREPLRPGAVDLGQLVREVRRDLAPDLVDRRVTWRVGELPVVRGDVGLLRQVVGNLLSNALKYTRTRDEAVVEVWAERGGEGWTVSVRDNGVGFDPRYKDKLFGAFQRLHRADEFEGVGIGLANVQRIVSRHGGRVSAEAVPGEGAVFSFSLPDGA